MDLGAAVQPHEGVLPMSHVLLQKVDHPGHLGVDQDPVALRLELGKKSVENEKFSGVENESFFVCKTTIKCLRQRLWCRGRVIANRHGVPRFDYWSRLKFLL